MDHSFLDQFFVSDIIVVFRVDVLGSSDNEIFQFETCALESLAGARSHSGLRVFEVWEVFERNHVINLIRSLRVIENTYHQSFILNLN